MKSRLLVSILDLSMEDVLRLSRLMKLIVNVNCHKIDKNTITTIESNDRTMTIVNMRHQFINTEVKFNPFVEDITQVCRIGYSGEEDCKVLIKTDNSRDEIVIIEDYCYNIARYNLVKITENHYIMEHKSYIIHIFHINGDIINCTCYHHDDIIMVEDYNIHGWIEYNVYNGEITTEIYEDAKLSDNQLIALELTKEIVSKMND